MVTRIMALLERPEQVAEIKGYFENHGYEFEAVNTFTKAKAILQKEACDLIISDAHLQNGGTVFDFLKWVKNDTRLCAIPFVVFSLEPTDIAKYLSDGVRTSARFLGAARYISMDSFDSVFLTDEIAELLPAKTITESLL